MFNRLNSKNFSIIILSFFVAIIGILFYPFQLFFSGKWEARPYVSFTTIEKLKESIPGLANSGLGNSISEFLQQNGIESLGFRYYSLTLFIGAVLGLGLLIHFFNKQAISEIAAEKVFINSLILGLIGSRALFVLINITYFRDKPLDILNLQQGGLSLFGGLILVAIYLAFYSWRNKFNLFQITDAVVPSTLMVLIWARFGNFFNYESYGPAAQVPWRMFVPEGAVINNRYDLKGKIEQFYHPAFLYEIIPNIILLVIIVGLYDRSSRNFGRLTSLFMVGYGVVRFVVEYFRLDSNILVAGFTWGQVFALKSIVLGFLVFGYSFFKSKKLN